jgi:hypothetical protein
MSVVVSAEEIPDIAKLREQELKKPASFRT